MWLQKGPADLSFPTQQDIKVPFLKNALHVPFLVAEFAMN